MPRIKNTITEIFDRWIEGPVSHYDLADHGIYRAADTKIPKRSALNPFLQNEADVRIKFGGFLEQELLDSDGGLTVHSEQNVTHDSELFCRTDLSIHEVPNRFSLTENDCVSAADTVRAVIQVRLIDYFSSKNKSYDYTDFHSDFACLSELPEKVDKFLLIIDEGEAMDADVIDDIRKMARECKVELFSNNELLSSGNF